MLYGICNLSIVPLRLLASETSEMTNQILFGEHFEVLEKNKYWSKIKLAFDEFEGYIDNKQYLEVSEDFFNKLSNETAYYAGELIDFITDNQKFISTIPMGAKLPLFKEKRLHLNNKEYSYEGETINNKLPKIKIIETAFNFLNVPYLHGGKSPFGIDADGFTQTVYKLCGYYLARNAEKQATQGEVLSFIEESEPGDLAFFDDEEGNIIHVGIVMNDYDIIHCYGKVRIDKLDHSGIYNTDTQKHSHKLRMIKKLI